MVEGGKNFITRFSYGFQYSNLFSGFYSVSHSLIFFPFSVKVWSMNVEH